MKKIYEPKSQQQKIGYLIEEIGELQSALGKTLRWGWGSVNPELPPDEQETNASWVIRKIVDVKRGLKFIEEELNKLWNPNQELK